MNINLEIGKLVKLGITPSQYIYLLHLVKGEIYPFTDIGDEDIKHLQSKQYIRKTPDAIVVRAKAQDLMEKQIAYIEVAIWIDEWRSLWPDGVKVFGRPVKGDKKNCKKKMETFIKENPLVTKDQIFEATRIYLFEKERDNWKIMTCADYFIHKQDRGSLLGSLIEDIDKRGSYLKDLEEGGGAGHIEI